MDLYNETKRMQRRMLKVLQCVPGKTCLVALIPDTTRSLCVRTSTVSDEEMVRMLASAVASMVQSRGQRRQIMSTCLSELDRLLQSNWHKP